MIARVNQPLRTRSTPEALLIAELQRIMDDEEVNQSELARRLGQSPSAVSQMIRRRQAGMSTIVKCYWVLGYDLRFKAIRKENGTF